jgi:acyl carrier protein
MTKETLERTVRTLVAEILETEPDAIDAHAALVEDLGMDSMRSIEILAVLEQTFGITIPEDELLNVASLNDAIALARRYVGGEAAA